MFPGTLISYSLEALNTYSLRHAIPRVNSVCQKVNARTKDVVFKRPGPETAAFTDLKLVDEKNARKYCVHVHRLDIVCLPFKSVPI